MSKVDIPRILAVLRDPYWTGKTDDESLHILGSRREVPMFTLGDLRELTQLAQDVAKLDTQSSLPPLGVFVWVRREGLSYWHRDRIILVKQDDETIVSEWERDATLRQKVCDWSFLCPPAELESDGTRYDFLD